MAGFVVVGGVFVTLGVVLIVLRRGIGRTVRDLSVRLLGSRTGEYLSVGGSPVLLVVYGVVLGLCGLGLLVTGFWIA